MAEACNSCPREVEENGSVPGTQQAQGLPRLLREGRGAPRGMNLTVPVTQEAAKGRSRESRLSGLAWVIYQDCLKSNTNSRKREEVFPKIICGKACLDILRQSRLSLVAPVFDASTEAGALPQPGLWWSMTDSLTGRIQKHLEANFQACV